MVSANISEIKPRGLTDRLEEKGEKIELKTLKLKSNGSKEAEALFGEAML